MRTYQKMIRPQWDVISLAGSHGALFLTLAQFHSATKSRSHHRQSSFSLASHPRQSRLFPSSFSFPSSPSHNHDQSWLSEGEPCQSVIIFQSAVLISQLTPIAAIARSFLSFLSFFFSFLPYKVGSVGHLEACVYKWGRQAKLQNHQLQWPCPIPQIFYFSCSSCDTCLHRNIKQFCVNLSYYTFLICNWVLRQDQTWQRGKGQPWTTHSFRGHIVGRCSRSQAAHGPGWWHSHHRKGWIHKWRHARAKGHHANGREAWWLLAIVKIGDAALAIRMCELSNWFLLNNIYIYVKRRQSESPKHSSASGC